MRGRVVEREREESLIARERRGRRERKRSNRLRGSKREKKRKGGSIGRRGK